MNKSLRLILPVVLVGVLATGTMFAKPVVKADQAAAKITAPLGGLKDTPRLRLALGRLIRELDLTPAQVETARDILKTHHDELSAAFDGVAAARADLRKVIRSSPTDAALAAASDKVADAQSVLVLATARLRVDLREVLTAEQLAKLETLEAKFEARIAKVRGVVSAWIESA